MNRTANSSSLPDALKTHSERAVRVRWAAVLITVWATASGCSTFTHQPLPDYRTVEASPHRDTPRAEREHQQALKILDGCQKPWTCPLDCGCIRGKLCNLHRAEEHLQNALIADVRYGPAHNTLGMLYFSQGKLYLAAWEFDYAIRLMKGRPEPLNNMGLVYEAAGQNDQAVEKYAEAMALMPDHPDYIGNLARAQLKTGMPLSAVSHLLERTVIVDPRPEWVAWANDQLGRHPSDKPELAAPIGADPVELDPGPAEELPAGETVPLPIEDEAGPDELVIP